MALALPMNQTVPHVDECIETLTEQMSVGMATADRLHEKTLEMRASESSFRYNFISDAARKALQFNALGQFSGWAEGVKNKATKD